MVLNTESATPAIRCLVVETKADGSVVFWSLSTPTEEIVVPLAELKQRVAFFSDLFPTEKEGAIKAQKECLRRALLAARLEPVEISCAGNNCLFNTALKGFELYGFKWPKGVPKKPNVLRSAVFEIPVIMCSSCLGTSSRQR